MLLHDSPNLVMNGVQGQTVGSHSSGEMKSAVSRADQLCHAPNVQVHCSTERQNCYL